MTLSDKDLEALASKAKAATTGPWEAIDVGGWGVVAGPTSENRRGYVKGGRGQVAEMDDLDASPAKQRANAKFIAAANPQAVAALVAEVLELRSRLKRNG